MKFIKMVFSQYTTTFVRELLIMLLAGYLVYALSISISPISQMISTISELKTVMTQKTLLFSPYDRVARIMSGFIGNPENERNDMKNKLEQTLFGIDGVTGIGRTGEFQLEFEGAQVRCIVYDDDMIRFIKLKLDKGTWFSEEVPSHGRTPIIIGGPIKKKLSVGQTLDIELAGEYDGVFNCEVIGILDASDMYVSIGSGATDPKLSAIVHANTAMNPSETSVFIVPLSKLDFAISPSNLSMSTLLFFDSAVSIDNIAETLNARNEYGHFHTFDRIAANELAWNLHLFQAESVISISLFLFGIIGLGGYMLLSVTRNEFMMGVYYLSGMSKKKYVVLTLTSTSILIILPSVLMMILSPFIHQVNGGVDRYTNLMITTVILLIILFANLISIRRVLNFSIIRLLEAGD